MCEIGYTQHKYEFVFADNTEFYADSVEWCPFRDYAKLVACGAYQLEENNSHCDGDQTRTGSVMLYRVSFQSEGVEKLEKVSSFNCSGVLDMKWCPKLVENKILLAVACSDGKILVLQLCHDKELFYLSEIACINLAENAKKLVLSLDWSCESDGSLKIISSDTLGHLNYIGMNENGLTLLSSWKCHDFESWISAFDYSQPHIVYSGGDDCLLKGWDVRNNLTPIFVSKRHSMGVTAISKCKKNEHHLVTGSYDENVFLWDTRSLKSTVSEISLGGGIWRLKWHPRTSDYLLSASMHNGFHVLSVIDSSLKVISHYDKHESLAYGVDWCNLPTISKVISDEKTMDTATENYIASCSFYDKLFNVWKINLSI